MKTLLISLSLVFALMASNPAKAQQHKFYYYPSSNVYYNIYGEDYVYYNNGSWVTAKMLPETIQVIPTESVILFHTGPDVWLENAVHVKKYRVHKATPVKVIMVKPVKIHKATPVKVITVKAVKVHKAIPVKVIKVTPKKIYKVSPAKKKVKLKH